MREKTHEHGKAEHELETDPDVRKVLILLEGRERLQNWFLGELYDQAKPGEKIDSLTVAGLATRLSTAWEDLCIDLLDVSKESVEKAFKERGI